MVDTAPANSCQPCQRTSAVVKGWRMFSDRPFRSCSMYSMTMKMLSSCRPTTTCAHQTLQVMAHAQNAVQVPSTHHQHTQNPSGHAPCTSYYYKTLSRCRPTHHLQQTSPTGYDPMHCMTVKMPPPARSGYSATWAVHVVCSLCFAVPCHMTVVWLTLQAAKQQHCGKSIIKSSPSRT